MEPDMIVPNVGVGAEASSAVRSGQVNSQNLLDRFAIHSFSTAIAALRQHTFKGVTDFRSAKRAAVDLHARTHEIVNTADISNLQAARDSLHPIDHYLAYISTLHATFAVVERDSPILSTLLADFRTLVRQTDARWARALPERWIGTARHVVRLAVDTPNPSRALSLVTTIREAADKLCTQEDELVSLHTDFLALCLHAKCFRVASKWIAQKPRLHVDASSGLQATDVHLMYYYSALVLIGRKDFRNALQKCRLALAVPAPSPGPFFAAAVKTYKLYILLHLFVVGTMAPALKIMSYQPGSMRKAVSEYDELAVAYESLDMGQMQQVIESNRGVFEKQGNLGIVKQLAESLFQKQICRLSNSYVTMTLRDIAGRVGLNDEDSTHQLLLEMVYAKRVNVHIDAREKVVRLVDTDLFDEDQLCNQVSSLGMSHCLDIMTRIQRFREVMDCDPDYVKRDMTEQHGRKTTTATPFAAAASAIPRGVTELEAEYMR